MSTLPPIPPPSATPYRIKLSDEGYNPRHAKSWEGSGATWHEAVHGFYERWEKPDGTLSPGGVWLDSTGAVNGGRALRHLRGPEQLAGRQDVPR